MVGQFARKRPRCRLFLILLAGGDSVRKYDAYDVVMFLIAVTSLALTIYFGLRR